jgi:hypothetical protein
MKVCHMEEHAMLVSFKIQHWLASYTVPTVTELLLWLVDCLLLTNRTLRRLENMTPE